MMKAAALMSCIAITLSVAMVKDVCGSKSVSNKELNMWTVDNKDMGVPNMGIQQDEIKNSLRKTGKLDELGDLLEVVQYIIVDSLNNSEFRSFMIKRFLHNYTSQASSYLDKIKKLKKKMNPVAANADDEKDRAMKNY
ncbi:uncharacterized protein LOC112680723 isoform X1 [Sipha flava]|uniref:Uncharacterized protein LOC112680723 isoform X1 n=2 Tax=Sipha flava TaxID=143950 RepID=A0A8B8F7U0_9HEMI|nr:uncharacterized protein LOC112680723 isoform X1 [Sipha flava]